MQTFHINHSFIWNTSFTRTKITRPYSGMVAPVMPSKASVSLSLSLWLARSLTFTRARVPAFCLLCSGVLHLFTTVENGSSMMWPPDERRLCFWQGGVDTMAGL